MFSLWIVAASCVLPCQGPAPSAAEIAERELRKHGAAFAPVGLCYIFLHEHKGPLTEAEIVKLHAAHAKFKYVVMDNRWKGEDEDLKYLRDLPNLKEIVWGGRHFHNGWCKEIESIKQLEGLFFDGRLLNDEGVAVVAKLPNLIALSLLETNVTDDGLRHLKGLTKLRWLSLSGARNITDKGLVHLKDLKNLEDLSLEVTKTSPDALMHLQGLTKLRRIRLSNYGYGDNENPKAKKNPIGLKHLANMTDLRMLDARGFCAGDDDLKHLGKMTKLEELNLCYTKVTDKGLEHLAGLTKLNRLDLFGTGVTGHGLKHLRNLKSLRYLILGFCPLEDSAVEHLRHMTHLEYLEVGDTNMTKKAIDELKRLLPKTGVR
jgi:internalin A